MKRRERSSKAPDLEIQGTSDLIISVKTVVILWVSEELFSGWKHFTSPATRSSTRCLYLGHGGGLFGIGWRFHFFLIKSLFVFLEGGNINGGVLLQLEDSPEKNVGTPPLLL